MNIHAIGWGILAMFGVFFGTPFLVYPFITSIKIDGVGLSIWAIICFLIGLAVTLITW